MQATQGTLSSLPSVCLSYAFRTRSQSVCPAPTSPSLITALFSLFLLSLFSSTSCLPHASWVFPLIFVIRASFPICLSTPICCLSVPFPGSVLLCSFQLAVLLCRPVSREPSFPFLLPSFFLLLCHPSHV